MEERERIGADLHDGTAHGLRRRAHPAEGLRVVGEPDNVRSCVTRALGQVDSAMTDLRRVLSAEPAEGPGCLRTMLVEVAEVFSACGTAVVDCDIDPRRPSCSLPGAAATTWSWRREKPSQTPSATPVPRRPGSAWPVRGRTSCSKS
ncbi:MAG: histidine kinase, partial [Acidimicrobiales bacterium]